MRYTLLINFQNGAKTVHKDGKVETGKRDFISCLYITVLHLGTIEELLKIDVISDR